MSFPPSPSSPFSSFPTITSSSTGRPTSSHLMAFASSQTASSPEQCAPSSTNKRQTCQQGVQGTDRMLWGLWIRWGLDAFYWICHVVFVFFLFCLLFILDYFSFFSFFFLILTYIDPRASAVVFVLMVSYMRSFFIQKGAWCCLNLTSVYPTPWNIHLAGYLSCSIRGNSQSFPSHPCPDPHLWILIICALLNSISRLLALYVSSKFLTYNYYYWKVRWSADYMWEHDTEK